MHAEGAFLFDDSLTSAITESLTGQALSLIYTPTPAVDLEAPGLEHLRGTALGFRNLTNYIASHYSKPATSDPSYILNSDEPVHLDGDSLYLVVSAYVDGPVSGNVYEAQTPQHERSRFEQIFFAEIEHMYGDVLLHDSASSASRINVG